MFQVFPNVFKLCRFLSGFKIIIINWGDSCECRKDSCFAFIFYLESLSKYLIYSHDPLTQERQCLYLV